MKYSKLIVILISVLGAQAEAGPVSRIINGHTSPNVGYNAYVLYSTADYAGYFGGGTIISKHHVLTSAKVIVGFVQWEVGVGSNVFGELTIIRSRNATAHPLFDSHTSTNDIGIIILPQPLVFTFNVFPVALPDLNAERTNRFPLENEEGAIVGFGYTTAISTDKSDLLMRAFQRVTDDSICERIYQSTLPQHFCAEDNVDFSNACVGDVGVGFVTYVRGRPTVTGIASYIREVCGNINPTGYTRVEYFREWIRSVTQL